MSDPKFDSYDDNQDEPVSKSALKREMLALQKLGQQLIDMPDALLIQIPLSDEMREGIALHRRLKQREARRRQLQFIGKQMRREDSAAIAAALAQIEQRNLWFRQHFQRIEILRDELIRDGDPALTALLNDHPDLDRQLMRQAIRQARQEAEHSKPPAASRRLFDYLREALDISPPDIVPNPSESPTQPDGDESSPVGHDSPAE